MNIYLLILFKFQMIRIGFPDCFFTNNNKNVYVNIVRKRAEMAQQVSCLKMYNLFIKVHIHMYKMRMSPKKVSIVWKIAMK